VKPITYVSDQAADYTKALTAAKSMELLTQVLEEYRAVFPDALDAAPQTDEQFVEFRAGLLKERKGQFAGEDWATKYGAILMPELGMRVSMVANQFHVPWGCAYIRLAQAGRIKHGPDGVARWQEGNPGPRARGGSS